MRYVARFIWKSICFNPTTALKHAATQTAGPVSVCFPKSRFLSNYTMKSVHLFLCGLVLNAIPAWSAAPREVDYLEPARPYASSPFLQSVKPNPVDLKKGALHL